MGKIIEEIGTADSKDAEQVGLYLFEIIIDGLTYGGHIPAKSWDEAQSKVELFGAKIYGLSQEIITDKICSICRGEIREDTSKPQPIETDDFFDDNDCID